MDPAQLCSNAYANTQDSIHDIKYPFFTAKIYDSTPIFRKLRMSMSDCKIKDNRLLLSRSHVYSGLGKSSTLPYHPSSRFSFRRGNGNKSRTVELLTRHSIAAQDMAQLVRRFVRNCKKKALAQKLLIKSITGCYILYQFPNTPSKEVALDFVTGLPQVGELNAICVVIDRLTSNEHYIPFSDTIDARGIGKAILFSYLPSSWTARLHYVWSRRSVWQRFFKGHTSLSNDWEFRCASIDRFTILTQTDKHRKCK